MAKQKGAILFNGKFANAVGYKAYDGRGDSFQGMRVYQAEVANPQTLAQMSQRMKLTPVQNFYRGMQYLLNHSWQGVKYKNPSRLHFYSQAMRALSTYGVPYVPKGDRSFVPWRFPVSSGSVAANTACSLASNNVITQLLVGTVDGDTTWGTVSQELVNGNFLKQGDQLTFISVLKNGTQFVPVWGRYNIDINSEVTLSDIADDAEAGVTLGNTGGMLSWIPSALTQDSDCVAGAIIVSRLQNNVWERSNSIMAVDASIIQQYNSSTAFAEMLASYQKTKNTDSDWYLNDGTEAEETEAVASIKTGSLSVGGETISIAYYSINGQKIAPVERVVYQSMVSYYAFTRINASTIQRAQTAYGIDDEAAAFTAAGYTQMDVATFRTTYPEITVQS